MRKVYILSTAMLLVCAAFAISAADETQQINFTKVAGKYSDAAWLAPNTKTGEILVVWLEEAVTEPWEDKVMAALFRPKNNGVFKKAKTRMLYQAEDLETPCVAYSSESNSYFAVWGEKDLQSGDHDILGRGLKANGRTKGSVIGISTGFGWNDSDPLIIDLPSAVGAPAGSRSFLAIWHGREADWLNNPQVQSGVFTCNLDATGQPLSQATLVLTAAGWLNEYGDLSRIKPEDVVRLPVDGVLVSAHEFVLDYGTAVENLAVFMTLDGGGGRVFYRNENYDGYPGTRVVSMSQNLSIGSHYVKGKPFNRRMKSNLKPNGKSYKFADATVTSADLVKLGADKGAYQVYATNEGLKGRYIKATGKLKGKEQALLDRSDLQAVRAEAIPGTNRIFAVIQYGSFFEANLMAYIFTAK